MEHVCPNLSRGCAYLWVECLEVVANRSWQAARPSPIDRSKHGTCSFNVPTEENLNWCWTERKSGGEKSSAQNNREIRKPLTHSTGWDMIGIRPDYYIDSSWIFMTFHDNSIWCQKVKGTRDQSSITLLHTTGVWGCPISKSTARSLPNLREAWVEQEEFRCNSSILGPFLGQCQCHIRLSNSQNRSK